MNKIDYTKFTDEQLNGKLKELKYALPSAKLYVKRLGGNPEKDKGNNPKMVNVIKKEIARINTEISRRNNV